MKTLRKPTTLLTLVAVLGVAALLSACGSSSNSSSESSTSSSARTVDQAFVAEMIPHHELAVEMAEMAQEQGQHPQITQLADSIVETQSAEIEEMEPIADQIGANEEGGSSMSEDAKVLGLQMDEMGMSMDMSALDGAKPFDRAFIDMMVPHHEGAISMAKAELAKGENSKLQDLAKRIVAAQTKEIGAMNEWREEWYGGPVPPGAMAES